jgi:O-antigen/teichoic acid export membrane protein
MYLKQTKNFLANHLMGTLNGSLLPLLIGVLSTSSQVAYFGVALKIVSITSFILVPINKVVAPKYAACFKKNDKGGLGNVAQFSSRVTWLFSVPIILLLLLGANHLLTFFGDDYLDNALIIFYIMLLGQLVNSLSGSVGWLLQMTNNEVLYRNLSTLNLFLMLTTAFIIIPEYGALGAAIVYSFSLIFINFTSAYYVKKKIGINIYRFW